MHVHARCGHGTARPRAGTPALPGRELPLDALQEMHSRILSEVRGIARVALDISPKPPATTEWE